jgi:hypothetical protein
MTYKTQEYVHKDDNGDVVSTVRVHEVTKDEAGESVRTTGGDRTLVEGDVLVGGDNPNVWDVLTKDQLNESGYKDASGKSATRPANVTKA